MARRIIGTLGSVFAALCCIGTPALLAFLTSIGAGFLINDLILLPLLVVFLAVTIWGIARSTATHGQRAPLVLAIVASGVVVAAVWLSRLLVLAGLAALIVASLWGLYLARTCATSATPASQDA